MAFLHFSVFICSLNRLVHSLLPAFTEFWFLLQACTCTLLPTKNFRSYSRAQHAGSSRQMKTMHAFNIKTCVDKRTKRADSMNSHCELGFKLFFKTITMEKD